MIFFFKSYCSLHKFVDNVVPPRRFAKKRSRRDVSAINCMNNIKRVQYATLRIKNPLK